MLSVYIFVLVLCVADIVRLCRVKGKVADRSNKTVNAEGYDGKKEISKRSRGEASRLKRGVIDYNTANPAEEKGQKKANDVVIHNDSP